MLSIFVEFLTVTQWKGYSYHQHIANKCIWVASGDPNLINYTGFLPMSHKSCNLEEAWFIYSLLSIDPFGGTCGSCRPLRLDTGVLVGLVWTDPVRGFALRDRWYVSNEHKASYLKKCLSLSHKPAQDRAGC